MKVYLVKDSKAVTGVRLSVRNDKGVEEQSFDVTITKDGVCYELPTNPSNRKWVNIKKMDGKDELELTYKESRTVSQQAPRKGLEEYLEGKDKETYLALVAKAKANREAANKPTPKTDLEKAKAMVEKYTKMVEQLSKEAK